MDKQELELERLVREVDKKQTSALPLYEVFVTFVSMTLAVLLFWADTLEIDMFSLIMSQQGWAFTFFVSAIFSAVGLLVDIKWLRILGMICNFSVYASIAIMVANIQLLNATTVVFGYISIFCIVSLPFVKNTKISRKHNQMIDELE